MYQRVITSNVAGTAPNIDTNLVDPRGIVVTKDVIWVISYGTSLLSNYTYHGSFRFSVSVPTPTGITTDDKGKVVYISSSNGNVYSLNVKNLSKSNTSNQTLTPYISPGGNLSDVAWMKGKLYVASYSAGTVDIYNGTNKMDTMVDRALASFNYQPFGLYTHCGNLYVSYSDNTRLTGHGYVNVYKHKHNTFERLISRSNLSWPHGMYVSGNDLIVASAGTGVVSLFNKDTGEYKRDVVTPEGGVLINDGVSAITEQNDKLYFTAANNEGKMGSIGYFFSTVDDDSCSSVYSESCY